MSGATFPNQVWPPNQEYLPAFNLIYYILALCTVSIFIRGRIPSWTTLKNAYFVQWTIIALLADVWCFLFLSVVVLLGVGTSRIDSSTGIPVTCLTTVWGAVLLYGGAKLCVLMFLAERVYLVHSHHEGAKVKRLRSRWYQVSLGCVGIWLVVGIIDILGKNAYIREHDGACILGIKPYASISLLAMDLVVSSFLTAAFVVPIYKSTSRSLRWLAEKSVFAAGVGFLSTTTNMLVMTLMGGQQISFVNLGSCSLDIALNALAIHLITKNDRSELNSSDHAIPIRPRHYAGVSISTELASVSDRHSTGQRYALSNRKSVNLEGILEGSKEIGSEESDAEKGVIEVVLPRK